MQICMRSIVDKIEDKNVTVYKYLCRDRCYYKFRLLPFFKYLYQKCILIFLKDF